MMYAGVRYDVDTLRSIAAHLSRVCLTHACKRKLSSLTRMSRGGYVILITLYIYVLFFFFFFFLNYYIAIELNHIPPYVMRVCD